MTNILEKLRDRMIMNGYPSDQNPKMMAVMEEAATRIEVLERELEQAAIRFETMHKTCTMLTGMALIGGENCRTPLT